MAYRARVIFDASRSAHADSPFQRGMVENFMRGLRRFPKRQIALQPMPMPRNTPPLEVSLRRQFLKNVLSMLMHFRPRCNAYLSIALLRSMPSKEDALQRKAVEKFIGHVDALPTAAQHVRALRHVFRTASPRALLEPVLAGIIRNAEALPTRGADKSLSICCRTRPFRKFLCASCCGSFCRHGKSLPTLTHAWRSIKLCWRKTALTPSWAARPQPSWTK